MRTLAALRTVGREWLVGLCAYALLVAPFGCEFQNLLTRPPEVGTKGVTGLFINPDLDAPLIVAGRNAAGDAFFVYGTRQSDGAIGEVHSIVVRTAGGETSSVTFEAGRPIRLQGADGSCVQISYHAVSNGRLVASATVYDAAAGRSESLDVDIDLQKTAAEITRVIQSLTGLNVALPAATGAGASKVQQRAIGPLVGSLLGGFVTAALVTLAEAMIVIVGQVMQAVFASVGAAMRAAVVAAFMPVYLFAGMVGEVAVSVNEVPLFTVFVEIPPPPHIVITFD